MKCPNCNHVSDDSSLLKCSNCGDAYERGLLDYLKAAISLRKSHPLLRCGTSKRRWSADGVYAIRRALDTESVIVALNVSEYPRSLAVPRVAKRAAKVIFGSASDLSAKDGRVRFTIPAQNGVVVE